jgi:Ca2+-transporting ATPase
MEQGSRSTFGISAAELDKMNESKDLEQIKKVGGVSGLARLLRTSVDRGIDPGLEPTKDQRMTEFGNNKLKEIKPKPFLQLLINNLKDPILILLMAAALVSTVLGAAVEEERKQGSWAEGVAIWVAVIVVCGVGAGNDYRKDQQFCKLNARKDQLDVKVIRQGAQLLVPNTDVCVGDILLLETGDQIVADGYVFESRGLVADESSLTGESEPLHKGPEDPWCKAGTQVTEGQGRALVMAVGLHTEHGRTMSLVMQDSPETPLQKLLARLVGYIGKIGGAVAIVCFIALLVRWCIEEQGFPADKIVEGPLSFFIFAVTIVVVCVPEGLPLAVTISLAYSTQKMLKDNNFVRVLSACETMGSATAICSDKTGTLTENRMTVVEGWFAGVEYNPVPSISELNPRVIKLLSDSIAVNSSAFLVLENDGRFTPVGNRTECALLMLMRDWGLDWASHRQQAQPFVRHLFPFSSAIKMASAIQEVDSHNIIYTKGAAEIVLKRCSKLMTTDGSSSQITPQLHSELDEIIVGMASHGLRTLCLAYRQLEPKEGMEDPDQDLLANDLTCIAIVGIKDPTRKEVPAAVRVCQHAGIRVRMVTGDNKYTASHIARECGILTDGLVWEGPDFRVMSDEDVKAQLPQLQVLARSAPTDKYRLVQLLKSTGEVVAVTGDGTNDAPALKEADVGLAMGIAGTEVAKGAADIVIMDDNFSSIVKSVLWGRCVFSNIRKFLQFQITVNFVAVTLAFVAAVTSGETPLTVIQLLWVNLIMDALAALALATENPSPDLLQDKPNSKGEFIINRRMWKHIITQGLYQLFWCFLIVYGASRHIDRYRVPNACEALARLETGDRYDPSINLRNVAQTPPYVVLNLCCLSTTVAATDPCLVANGGLYQPGEVPLCASSNLMEQCTINDPAGYRESYCGAGVRDCERYDEFHRLFERHHSQHEEELRKGREQYSSVVFNAFIWMQLFNQINSRKIKDELNVFEGLSRSRVFIYLTIVEVVLQLIIMFTPARVIFKVKTQNWQEWLFALALGAGSLLVALITKLVTRAVYGVPEASMRVAKSISSLGRSPIVDSAAAAAVAKADTQAAQPLKGMEVNGAADAQELKAVNGKAPMKLAGDEAV